MSWKLACFSCSLLQETTKNWRRNDVRERKRKHIILFQEITINFITIYVKLSFNYNGVWVGFLTGFLNSSSETKIIVALWLVQMLIFGLTLFTSFPFNVYNHLQKHMGLVPVPSSLESGNTVFTQNYFLIANYKHVIIKWVSNKWGRQGILFSESLHSNDFAKNKTFSVLWSIQKEEKFLPPGDTMLYFKNTFCNTFLCIWC